MKLMGIEYSNGLMTIMSEDTSLEDVGRRLFMVADEQDKGRYFREGLAVHIKFSDGTTSNYVFRFGLTVDYEIAKLSNKF